MEHITDVFVSGLQVIKILNLRFCWERVRYTLTSSTCMLKKIMLKYQFNKKLLIIINAALKFFTTSNTAVYFFLGTAGCSSKFTFRDSAVCIAALSLNV